MNERSFVGHFESLWSRLPKDLVYPQNDGKGKTFVISNYEFQGLHISHSLRLGEKGGIGEILIIIDVKRCKLLYSQLNSKEGIFVTLRDLRKKCRHQNKYQKIDTLIQELIDQYPRLYPSMRGRLQNLFKRAVIDIKPLPECYSKVFI